MKRDQRGLITLCTLIAVLAVSVRLTAQDHPQTKEESPRSAANYNFLIGSGFLCGSDDSTACPAVARAANQETIEVSGAGTLGLANKSVTAAGAFIERTPTGEIVTAGVWTTMGLVSFESYGIAPGALRLDYPKLRAFEALPMGKMPGPMAAMMAGPIAAGGLATVRIRLWPDAGSPRDAMLQVNCAKGKVPAGEQNDGVRLAVTGGPEFDEEISGRALFLLQRPGPNSEWKDPTTAGAQR